MSLGLAKFEPRPTIVWCIAVQKDLLNTLKAQGALALTLRDPRMLIALNKRAIPSEKDLASSDLLLGKDYSDYSGSSMLLFDHPKGGGQWRQGIFSIPHLCSELPWSIHKSSGSQRRVSREWKCVQWIWMDINVMDIIIIQYVYVYIYIHTCNHM